MSDPPATAREVVTETLHGESIDDPYRWLEGDAGGAAPPVDAAGDDPVAAWERRQNEHTDAVVDGDRRADLRPRYEALAERTTYLPTRVAGGRYFQRVEPAGAEQPRLTVREGRDEEPRTLVDPAERGDTTALSWFVPSPDGRRVAYGLTEAGVEQYDVVVREVPDAAGEVDDGDAADADAGAVDSAESADADAAGTDADPADPADDPAVVDVVEDIGRISAAGFGWAPDGESFYYATTGTAGDGDQLDKELRRRAVGGEDRLLTDDIPRERWPSITVDDETGTVVVAFSELASDSELYVIDGAELVPVLTGVDAEFTPLAHGGRVHLRTNHDADRFRVLGADAASLAGVDAVDDLDGVDPEGEDVLFDLAPAGDGIAVHRIRDARSVVSVHDGDGDRRHELSLPEFVGIPRGALLGGEAEITFPLSGFDRPDGIVHADVGPDAGPDDWTVVQSESLPAGLRPTEDLDLTVERLWVESTGDVEVPVYVVRRSDVDRDGAGPAVLSGYGGFRIPRLPGIDPYALSFVADGGVYAQACLRGGLEFGETWHRDGAREHKEHTFDDFEAAARALADRGYTTPERLSIWGGSNGGLTVGAALTRSPELFGAALCSVPLLDMLRFHRFLIGAAWTGEYGSPEDPEAFEWLRSYSPYHNVAERAYPATLFATAAGDTRVHPAHARKMTARVQAATTGDDPICYRSVDETGHGVGTPTSLEVQQELDKWAFVYETLDVGR